MTETFGRVLSLGPLCETKMNTARILRSRSHLTRWVRNNGVSPAGAPSGPFDWQSTPERALLAYFRQDFRGMFERDDLVQGEDGISNQRYGTWHPHEFSRSAGPDAIGARYVESRARHDYLCAKFRAMLAEPVKTLFLSAAPLSPHASEEIRREIERRRHGHPFAVLCLDIDQEPYSRWAENEAAWDAAFADIRIKTTAWPALPPPSFFQLQARRLGRHVLKARF